MSAVDELLPWMPKHIKRLLGGEFGDDWTDAEIVDDVERLYRSPKVAVTIRDHRLIEQAVRELRVASRSEVTEEAVRAEKDRRRAAGEPDSYGALAEHFHVNASTIRRRLGVLPRK
jgi:hypothetical protein